MAPAMRETLRKLGSLLVLALFACATAPGETTGEGALSSTAPNVTVFECPREVWSCSYPAKCVADHDAFVGLGAPRIEIARHMERKV